MDFIPKQIYDDLLVKYNELLKENNKLKDELLLERNKYNEFKKDMLSIGEEMKKIKRGK